MRDIATKTDGTTSLAAGDFNALQNELENTVTSTGQTLDPAGGADTDLNMLSKAMADYAGAGWGYTDSGAVNAHVVAITTTLKPPTEYFDNLVIAYIPNGTNTSTTVTTNVASLGVKNIRLVGGGLPPVGFISASGTLILKYNDSAGYFEIMVNGSNLGQALGIDLTLTGSAASPPDANTLVKDNIVKGWINFDGTGVISTRDSFNVSSIVDNGAGNYTINWDRDFANTNYCITGINNNSNTNVIPVNVLVGSCDINLVSDASVFQDTNIIMISAIGGQ